jgi:hypothetical protein
LHPTHRRKTMKKLLLTLALVLAWISTQAKELTDYDYVVTSSTTYYCEEIKQGVKNTHVKLYNGEALVIKNNEILAYKKNGRIFEKMPLYCHNQYVGRRDYMELIAYKNGLKLYKYNCRMGCMKMKAASDPCEGLSCKLLVFRNGEYHLELDDHNYKTVLNYFGITVKSS